MEKKNYIVVTQNNDWLSTIVDATLEDLKNEIDSLKEIFNEKDVEYYAYEYINEPLKF